MAEDSNIEWTTHTFNCWRGCTKISPGCTNCYAATFSGRNPDVLGVWGPNGTRVVASESQWREPLKWNKVAALAQQLADEAERSPPVGYTVLPYQRPRVFCASLADVFEAWDGPMVDSKGNEVYITANGTWSNEKRDGVTELGWRPLTMDDARQRLFDTIVATPHLDWLLLTKRPAVMREWLRGPIMGLEETGNVHYQSWPWPNVWLGVTVEDQQRAKERIPILLDVPAPVHFLSCEPLLGPLDVSDWLYHYPTRHKGKPWPHGRVNWAIVGGESGHGARPFALDWARALVAQCKDAGVGCFVKQMGENAEDSNHTVGRFSLALNDKKGGDPSEWPAELRVRQFPSAKLTGAA